MLVKKYRVIGLMSGTSLDGLDIACCDFSLEKGRWRYKIIHAQTIPYPENLSNKLRNSMVLGGNELSLLNCDYGQFIGEKANSFIRLHKIKGVDLIASHGHTVFHQPSKKMTLQIGDANAIHAKTGIPVISDFRALDVALGGQGAPLVPVGDKFLFKEFDFCLNLGGIANISFDTSSGKRVAFDICPCNIPLNYLANALNQPFDKGGKKASSGILNSALLNTFQSLSYYKKKEPKSLGREWIDKEFMVHLKTTSLIEHQLRTVVEHIALQVSNVVNKKSISGKSTVLITGGGALNTFLVDRIGAMTNAKCIVPDKTLLNYKEALIFAFLGVLRLRNETNTFASVTGATRDSSGGVIHGL